MKPPTSPTKSAERSERSESALPAKLRDGAAGGAPLGRTERLRAHLERSRWVRPTMLALVAVLTGALLSPQLTRSTFPTDTALLGTPASDNIKSPRELSVIDRKMTERLRQKAADGVRRVFDFDVGLGRKLATQVRSAFADMRERAAEVLAQRSDLDNLEELSGGERAQLIAQIGSALEAGRPSLEERLGIRLSEQEAAQLQELQYSQDFAQRLGQTVARVLSQPVIDRRETLTPDRGRGITIQRVPDDGEDDRVVQNVDTIKDVATAKQTLPDRVAAAHPELPAAQAELLVALARRVVQPNLTVNRAATELAREMARLAVKPVNIAVKKGEMIIRDGERITRRHLLLLEELNTVGAGTSVLLVGAGAGLLALVLMVVAWTFARHQSWWQSFSTRDTVFLSSLLVALLAAARLWEMVARTLAESFSRIPAEALFYCMPVAASTMVARLVLRTEIAVLFGIFCSLLLGLLVEGPAHFGIFALAGAVLGSSRIGSFSARSDLLKGALWIGLGMAAVAGAMQLFAAKTAVSTYVGAMGGAFAGGMLSGFVALAVTPVIEAVFGYTTDLRLLELANLNHPALKELIVQAPGSYHHSVIVGTLVEAAAEACGANPLLARVMAYYHDLGKGCNPAYFIENQRSSENPHNKLKPSMSAMVIKRHVTDGIEIAKRHGLGEAIQAGIVEHHGTTLIQFFYHKAKEQADEQNPVAETDYRYPGRKPQTRESALVMLGDSVEAASRSLADPTPARLQGLVTRIINHKFTDGQLEECDLTLRDLHLIAKAFSRVLGSIYHQRPEYPGVLQDLGGSAKKQGHHADSHAKQSPKGKTASGEDTGSEEDRPDNIRRLGLS